MRYSGKILKGRGDGKRIVIPRPNFEVPLGFPQKQGIYAGWVWVEGANYPAAIHYGPAPTFKVAEASLEAHLIGVTLMTSPESGEIELVKFLREIEDFRNIEELQAQ